MVRARAKLPVIVGGKTNEPIDEKGMKYETFLLIAEVIVNISQPAPQAVKYAYEARVIPFTAAEAFSIWAGAITAD